MRSVHQLPGGTHADTFLIRTANPELNVVLRRFPAGDDAAGHEARVLTALRGLDGLAPWLLACDTAGAWSDQPSVLISHLPGRANITPADPHRWSAHLGRTLARIHAASPDRFGEFQSVFDRVGGSRTRVSGPASAAVAAGWDRLISAPHVLTHYDFWSGNVVWSGEELVGVVDWSGAASGPGGFDVGWCRLDLGLLFGVQIADVFLGAYEATAGSPLPDRALWDLFAAARSEETVEDWVPNYRDLGRADLTAAELRRRHSAWTRQLLQTYERDV